MEAEERLEPVYYLTDGKILVSRYFDKTWFLGQRNPFKKLAIFTKSNLIGDEFDSFIAHYDKEGNSSLHSPQVCLEVTFWFHFAAAGEAKILLLLETVEMVGLDRIFRKLN